MRRPAYIAVLLLLLAGCSDSPGDDDDGNGNGGCTLTPLPFNDALKQIGAVQDVHDPVLTRLDGRYYLYSTGHGIAVRESTDLISWTGPSRVLPVLPAWIDVALPGVEFPWAPDISFFSARFHLYYSLSGFGSQRSIIALVTNTTLDPDDAAYEWVDRGPVVESIPNTTNFNAIDSNVILDDAGIPWLAWGSFWDGIKMRRLDAATGLVSAADETIYSLARRPVEHAIEATFIFKHGNFFYLFVSFDSCCQGAESTYRIMVGRSEAVTGPYVDRNGTSMLAGGGTLVLDGYGRIRGPGHNAIYKENEREFLVHHFYDAQANGFPKLQVRSLLWDDEGWPLAGEPFNGAFPTEPASATPSLTGTWAHSTGSEAPYEITLKAGGILERCRGEGTWSRNGRSLSLSWTKGGYPDERVQVAADGSWYVGRTGDGILLRGVRRTTTNP